MNRICKSLAVVAAVLGSAPALAAPPAPSPVPQITFFIEGSGYWNAGRDSTLGLIDSPNRINGQGAIGFVYRFPSSIWHLNVQVRYGAGSSDPAHGNLRAVLPGEVCGPGLFSCALAISAGPSRFQQHNTVVDVAVGRDVVFGAGPAQVNFGIRFAEFETRSTLSGVYSALATITGPGSVIAIATPVGASASASCSAGCSPIASVNSGGTTFLQTNRFYGVGPRVAVEGALPFANGFSVDYAAGVAVLPGTGKFTATTRYFITTLERDTVVFNTDASVGIGYAFTQNVKMALGYRVDAYFDALRNPSGGSADYISHGPFARLTTKF